MSIHPSNRKPFKNNTETITKETGPVMNNSNSINLHWLILIPGSLLRTAMLLILGLPPPSGGGSRGWPHGQHHLVLSVLCFWLVQVTETQAGDQRWEEREVYTLCLCLFPLCSLAVAGPSGLWLVMALTIASLCSIRFKSNNVSLFC